MDNHENEMEITYHSIDENSYEENVRIENKEEKQKFIFLLVDK